MSKDTKGNHSSPSGVLSWREKQANEIKDLKKENVALQRKLAVHDFLDTGVPQERLDYQRELKKEIIRLKSLCRRSADEIRDLDDMIIKSIEDNKVIEYPEEDKAYFAGFSSINLLNRLEGRTNGGYIENYDDLNLEMKMTTDNKYRHIKEDCVAYQEGGMGCPDCYCDSSCKDDSCHICGGNTTERVEEQAARLEKIAEQKEINKVVDQVESAAIKAVHKVMEQHSKALEKLAENEE